MIKWFVPGRIEVFGKHTDYAGGHSILAAVDRGVTVTLTDADEFSATTDAFPGERIRLVPGQPLDVPRGHWGYYLQVALDRLTLNFGSLAPVAIHVSSTLPLASGMSSSSALVVAVTLAIAERNGLLERQEWMDNITSDLELAHYASCVENGYDYPGLAGTRGVGTMGGSEDHTAMLCCEEGKLTECSFVPSVRHNVVEFPADHSFVVGVCGVRAEKSGAAMEQYNYLSASTRDLVTRWQEATGRQESTLDEIINAEDGIDGLSSIVADDEALSRRLKAFVAEVKVFIPRAVAALRSGDLAEFGRVALESHRNADQNLLNQLPETNALVELAMVNGAVGASAFGAGWGGSVWALVPTSDAEKFAQRWGAAYREQFPQWEPEFIVTRPSQPARRV
ncbi:galactokinase family protein [Tessaracoccus sp. OH4464_COT-324]|uniref:GHMP family kinase ATP-binding protein n=1 Tax=Tessaracoccus sp. OH4464_COT-324 TaxID=2491059 RepID=UPI000F62D155|nr:galactokinase family protein [Tessaracoccus sp. OH4464_COT-324]RRD46955.1 galactokinase [Tessaracoccus sp. OH4464_COT-324]